MGIPNSHSWVVYVRENPNLEVDDDQGQPHFRKPPYVAICLSTAHHVMRCCLPSHINCKSRTLLKGCASTFVTHPTSQFKAVQQKHSTAKGKMSGVRFGSIVSVYHHSQSFTIIYTHLQSSTIIYIHLHTFTYIYLHLHTLTIIYIHLQSFTIIYTHIYSHLQSFTFIYIHLHTFTYIYIH